MTKYNKILVPVDGSENSYKALRKAAEISQWDKGEVFILTIQNDGRLYNQALPISEDNYTKASEMILEEALAHLDETHQIQTFVVVGNPKKQIVEFAKVGEMDLIVIGATGSNYFEQMTLGSTTSYVMNHALCNVMVVK